MKITLIEKLGNRPEGTELELTTAGAQHLIEQGYAEAPKPKQTRAKSKDEEPVTKTGDAVE